LISETGKTIFSSIKKICWKNRCPVFNIPPRIARKDHR
jgi:hypothetical protein